MILIFDKKHRSSRFENSMYFKLTKIENIEYHIFKTFSLSIKKIELFKIKKKISDLTYQLNFFWLYKSNARHNVDDTFKTNLSKFFQSWDFVVICHQLRKRRFVCDKKNSTQKETETKKRLRREMKEIQKTNMKIRKSIEKKRIWHD